MDITQFRQLHLDDVRRSFFFVSFGLLLHSRAKKGLFEKDLQSKFVAWHSLRIEAGKDDLTHIGQKAMVLYVMHFIKYLKMHSLESGSLPTYDYCSQGKFSPEFYFQFGFV